MPDLLYPRESNGVAERYRQSVSERTTAVTTATYLPHETLQDLLNDAAIILEWLRADAPALGQETPQDARDGGQGGLGPTDGQEEPDSP